MADEKTDLKSMPEEYWRERLTPEQFRITRMAGTEMPFTGVYNDHYQEGLYRCVACDQALFSSETKFKSGSGWPSFWDAVDENRVELREDRSHGMVRTEVRCSRCGAHLGHLFDDGPQPTGQRYCINSAALKFDDKSAGE
ncbi:MAG TPA: peptide-methionine (R)-S-oxide reductase MsrB [Aggregatilineales bacterium]|nr:peptide-methionine (R)-S-oxide reductase MsrB [Aggregatilineales bacterium]